ncbi:MAG: O-methyltransferase [Paenibacillaceae bacterium]|nr:O-methyltransferase [Paenibacillaceae bacterium]
MVLKSIPLPVQVDMIFEDLTEELCGLTAGTVFLHIRDAVVGTYGVRHRLEHRIPQASDGGFSKPVVSPKQVKLFREMAMDIVSRKSEWNRGTISYKFAVKQGALQVSADFTEKDDCLCE